MSPAKSILVLTTLGLLGLAGPAVAAGATTCTADADCGHGFTCQVSTVVTTTTITCDAGDCGPNGAGGAARHDIPAGDAGTSATGGSAAGGNAGTAGATGGSDPTDGGTGSTGPTTVTSTCQPGPCTIDSDCGTDMICHSETFETCSGSGSTPACPPDTKCDTSGVVSQSECTTQTVSTCAYKWALPCNANADCGDGFVCQPAIGGECSGSAPASGGNSGQADGGTAEPGTALVADTCTTTMTYPGQCQAAVQTCATDTDCPSDWVCQVVVTVGVEATDGSTGGDVAATPNTKTCTAPYVATPTLGTKDSGGAGGRTGTSSSSDPTGSGGNTGSVPPAGAQGTGGAGGTTASGPSGTGPAAGGANGAHDSSAPASADNSGGCAVIATGTRAGWGAALAMLAGLALMARRRRR